jgi:serine/threonine protein kinase/WD40 repeat protein
MNDDRTLPQIPAAPAAGEPAADQQLDMLWRQGGRPVVEEFLGSAGTLSQSQVAAVLGVDQRQRWQSGERVPAENYLQRFADLQVDAERALELIYGEYLLREEMGEAPPAEEYLQRFPQYAERLEEQFRLHRLLAQSDADRSVPLSDSATRLAPATRVSPADRPDIAGYEILGELGRGGMGVVYKARQIALNRVVALKMILGGGHSDPERQRRFRIEAEAVARLQHPNIVQVYDYGVSKGCPFLAMEFVDGRTLARKAGGVPQPPRDAAQIMETLAAAIHHAHLHHLVHRDLKPSNILRSADGVLKITDFGLAKQLPTDLGAASANDETATGELIGTPTYMAPEQVTGKRTPVGPATDIYALGVILYELLTGRTPFQGDGVLEVLEKIQGQEPLPPGRLQPGTPRDIETICLKCLRKDPGKRYATAAGLAEDLRRFLTDRPILARRASRREQFWRWCRRNPTIAGLTGSVLLLLFLLAVGALVAAAMFKERMHVAEAAEIRAQEERSKADESRRKADEERRKAEGNLLRAREAEDEGLQKLYQAYLSEARTARLTGYQGQRMVGLSKIQQVCSTIPSDKLKPEQILELREELIASLALPDLKERRRWPTSMMCPGTMAIDSRFEYYASCKRDGAIVVQRVEQGDTAQLSGLDHRFEWVACQFSPDDRLLLATYDLGHRGSRLVVWDWRKRVKVLDEALPENVPNASFSPGGRWLATRDPEGSVALFDLADGAARRHMKKLYHGHQMAFHPQGRFLAMTSRFVPVVQVVDWQKEETVAAFPTEGFTEGLAWSPDGRRLAAGSERGPITLWEWDQPKSPLILKGHQGPVERLQFSRDGAELASTGPDATCFWNVEQGKLLLRLAGSALLRYGPDSPEGQRQVAVIQGADVVILEKAGGNEMVTMPVPASMADFSPDGRSIATAGPNGVQFWDVTTGGLAADLQLDQCGTAAFQPHGAGSSPDVGFLVTFGKVSGPRLWPIRRQEPGKPRGWQVGPPRTIPIEYRPQHFWQQAAWSHNGRRLGVVDYRNGRAYVVDPHEPAKPRLLGGMSNLGSVALSPEGDWAALAAYDLSAVQVKPVTGGADASPILRGYAHAAFSPNGKWLVTGGSGEYCFWEVGSWTKGVSVRRDEMFAGAAPLAFSPQGNVLALTASWQRVRLVEAATGRTLAVLKAPDSAPISWLTFNADGNRLAVVRKDREVQIWNLEAVRLRLAELQLDWPLPALKPSKEAESSPAHIQVVQATGATGGTWSAYWRGRGVIDASYQKWSEAVQSYTEAIQRLPPNAQPSERAGLLHVRAINYCRFGCYQAAREDWEKAVELAPELEEARLRLAWLYVAGLRPVRAPHKALPMILTLAERRPTHDRTSSALGLVYFRLERYQAARDILAKKVQAATEPAPVDLFVLAMCHARLDEIAAANDCMKRARNLLERQRGRLMPDEVEELERFRSEAEEVVTSNRATPGSAPK